MGVPTADPLRDHPDGMVADTATAMRLSETHKQRGLVGLRGVRPDLEPSIKGRARGAADGHRFSLALSFSENSDGAVLEIYVFRLQARDLTPAQPALRAEQQYRQIPDVCRLGAGSEALNGDPNVDHARPSRFASCIVF